MDCSSLLLANNIKNIIKMKTVLPFLTNSNSWFDNVVQTLSRYSTFNLIMLYLLADLVISSLFSFVFFPNHPNAFRFESFRERIFVVVLSAPIIETLIFQFFVIEKSIKYLKSNKLTALFLSAMLFGLSHHYSIAYISKAFCAGLLFGVLYFVVQNKGRNPILYVTIAHASFNLIGVVINNFIE
jgi:Type II CAAX prenyl endopeptidase Rce1-like